MRRRGLTAYFQLSIWLLVVQAASVANAAESWVSRGGRTILWFPSPDITITQNGAADAGTMESFWSPFPATASLPIDAASQVVFTIDGTGISNVQGRLMHNGTFALGSRDASVVFPSLEAYAPTQGDLSTFAASSGSLDSAAELLLRQTNVQFHRARRQIVITSDAVSLSPALAQLLGDAGLVDRAHGLVTILVDVELIGGQEPAAYPTQTTDGASSVLAGDVVTGPDIIVSELQSIASYGNILTCRASGSVCEMDADCNTCSDTGASCLLDTDCRICSSSGTACVSGQDCMTCTGSGRPCVDSAECGGTETCVESQACVVSGATCIVTGDVCDAEMAGFAIGTRSCNLGDTPANWISFTKDHPVIAQSLFRLKDDRFEQIGQAWVKHGFWAVTGTFCGECITPPGPAGSQLGVGCSDPYSASLNGQQSNMSPKSGINPHTGDFTFPFDEVPAAPVIGKRIQVHTEDLDLTLNAGALYFVEGQYVAADDAQAGNGNNSASYRQVELTQNPDGRYVLGITADAGPTAQQQCGIRAWQDVDPSVVETDVQIPSDGLLILAAKAVDLGTGIWRYEYALQNLNSDRGCRSIEIPLPEGAAVTHIGFHDVAYHSGEPYAGDDWLADVAARSIRWSTATESEDPNANALRWGTLYNFHFRTNVEPDVSTVTLGLFKPGPVPEVTAQTIGPRATIDCNDNNVADACDLSCTATGCTWPCGGSTDCNLNGVPDECELDCNANLVADTCDIAQGVSLDCNSNTIPDECEPDCDGDSIPDECDTYDDTDGDTIPDCFDLCPLTAPSGTCQCPELGRCCFTEFFCLDDFPLASCEANGGTPDCRVSQACRDGCLINDQDDDGDVDLFDIAAFQGCFTGRAGDPSFLSTGSECLRVFDITDDQAVDLEDYAMMEKNITGP